MIRMTEIARAMKLLTNPIGYLDATAIEKQVARSLEVYEDRNEFDGSLSSAVECLTLAGYEIMQGNEGE